MNSRLLTLDWYNCRRESGTVNSRLLEHRCKKSIFQKGYEQTYSYEVFEVDEVKNTYPITYGLRDYKGEEIKGSFYPSEIQLVDKSDDIWPIERIVNTRKRRGITEYLVKFLGYTDAANTWISQSDLFDL